MSDVRRVSIEREPKRKGNAAVWGYFLDYPDGTHALMPWAKWERVRSFECCKDAERAPRLEAKVLEQRAEIERLLRVAEAATSLIECGYGDDRMKLKNALRELEDSDG